MAKYQSSVLCFINRRESSVGVELFQERGEDKRVRALAALAEDDEEGDSDDQEKSDEHIAAPPHEGKEKPTADKDKEDKPPDAKDTDPLAALGDKLAKLRYMVEIV